MPGKGKGKGRGKMKRHQFRTMQWFLFFFALAVWLTPTASGNFSAISKACQPGEKVYTKSQRCQQAEGEACIAMDGIECDVYDLADASIDDTSKPIYRAIDPGAITDCSDLADCASKIGDLSFTCPAGENPRYDQKSKHPTIPGPDWFLWCEKFEGWQQKLVKQWQENASKRAAKDAAKAAADSARVTRKNLIKDVAQQWGSKTDAEKLDALKALIEHLSLDQ